MTRSLRPVPDAPALLLEAGNSEHGRTLVVADLHLGLGGMPSSVHGPPGAAAPDLANELLRLAEAHRAQGILIAGDVKHPIVGVPLTLRPVIFRFFAELLRAGLSVGVVPGNHDGGLFPHLPREIVVHPSAGVLLDGVGVFHGHRWPDDRVGAARRLVVGHLHPGVRFAPTPDQPTGKRRCWVRVE